MLIVILQANATATFNFLLEEARLVGGAFIPPRTVEEDWLPFLPQEEKMLIVQWTAAKRAPKYDAGTETWQ